MRILLLIGLLLGAISCENETSVASTPDHLIPQDTMIMVLKRISLIEAHMMNSTLPMASFHSALRKSCEKVLHDFHLDINRFEKSMDYYATHQEEMTVIYTAILDSLTKESSKYSAIPAPSTKDKPVVSNPTLPGAPTEVRANSNEDSEPKPGLFRKRFRLQKRRKK